MHRVFRLAVSLFRICNGKVQLHEVDVENSEEVVMPFMQVRNLPDKEFTLLRTVRVTAARLLEPSIQTKKD